MRHFLIHFLSMYDHPLSRCLSLYPPLSLSLSRTETTRSSDSTETLIDLAGIDVPSLIPPQPAPPPQLSDPTPANPLGFSIPVLPPPPKRLAGLHASQTNSPSHSATDRASTALSLLDDELLCLGTKKLLLIKSRMSLIFWGGSDINRILTFSFVNCQA